jgi:hypothetical protein
LPHAAGDAIDLAHVVEAGEQLLGAGDHLVRGRGLRRLRPEPGGLLLQRGRLLLGVGALLLAALLVGHPLTQVVLPVHVVDVDVLAIRVQVEHPVHGLADELDVVADHDQPALVVLQELAQPHDAVGIEVVGRLVEDHRLRVGEQDARELDAAALTTGEGLQRLIEDPIREREVVGDGCRLRLGRIAAEGFEPLGEVRELAHRLLGDRAIGGCHVLGGLRHPELNRTEATGIQDPSARQHLGVTGTRVLGQIPELTRLRNLAAGGQHVAGEHLGERGLAGAVASDQPDLVAVGDAERHVLHQEACAHADLKVVHGKHSRRPFIKRGKRPRFTRTQGSRRLRASLPV